MGLQRVVRAPKGFFGMRGKKDYDVQLQEKRALLGLQQVGCLVISQKAVNLTSLYIFLRTT